MAKSSKFQPQNLRHFLFALLMLALFATLFATLLAPAVTHAAVPGESAKPAYAEEQTILQQEKDVPAPGWGSAQSGREHFDRHFIVPPGFMDQQDLILQRGGNLWRNWRNGPIATIAGFILLLVPLLIFGFFKLIGPAADVGDSGRRIQRFTYWDRFIHWSTAIAFLTLAISGVLLFFGKKIVLPWLGHDAFYWVATLSKTLHNFVGPLFILCSVAMFITYLNRNFFARWDWQWIKKGGGLLTHEHVPAGYFNAGEKLWFWGGVTLLGLGVSATGLLLDFPYFKQIGANIAVSRYLLQMADYLHIACATFYIAASMGHIYIGTWGTPGTSRGMREGDVDAEWARMHHQLWYEEVAGDGSRRIDHGVDRDRPMPPDALRQPAP